ncbi:MAG: hypothetical protein J6B07_01850 [Opitutales bacterium]|nr:hypothetical protein [Opitutales bacterium]
MATQWIKITEQDLQIALNKTQLDLLKAEAIKTANTSICTNIIELVVSRIRAEIAASGVNMLDIDYARIPPELKECALRLAIESLHVRIPAIELSQAQIRAIEDSKEILSRVATGKLPISIPTNAIKTARKHTISHGVRSRLTKTLEDF